MLVLPADVTHADAAACCRMLTQALRVESGSAIVADAGALAHFDSSALAVLLEVRREALANGKTFSVSQMPSRLRDLAAVYGVAELLPAAP
jgi:phospholipid transport system transporter-binding protein